MQPSQWRVARKANERIIDPFALGSTMRSDLLQARREIGKHTVRFKRSGTFEVTLQRGRGIAQILRAYHSHKWTEDFEEAFGRHFQLMIDSRGGALRRKEEAMAAA